MGDRAAAVAGLPRGSAATEKISGSAHAEDRQSVRVLSEACAGCCVVGAARPVARGSPAAGPSLAKSPGVERSLPFTPARTFHPATPETRPVCRWSQPTSRLHEECRGKAKALHRKTMQGLRLS
jgi:hypothetical protein